MATRYRDDLTVLLTPQAGGSDTRHPPLVAFVPIAVALVGLALIMFGGLTVRDPATITGAVDQVQVDPIATGSVDAARDRRRVLMMLDR